MGQSGRLLALYVDRRLRGEELAAVRERLVDDAYFARRAGMYREDDLLLRDALSSLRLTEGLTGRICSRLPEGAPERAAYGLTPPMALLLFLSAGIFMVGTVLFQGTARMMGMLGAGGTLQLVAHSVGVLAGFALLVWSGRQAARLRSALASGLVKIAQSPAANLLAQVLALLLLIGAGWRLFAPGFDYRSWDAVTTVGATHLVAILGIPLLIGLLLKAGELLAALEVSPQETLRMRLSHGMGLMLLLGACTAHYLVVVG